jgi:hypothetical protein
MAVWSATNTIKSATIAADGSVVARPPLSLAVLVNVFPSNAVWFGDAVHLVLTSSDEASGTMNKAQRVRFATDGSPPSGVTLFNELSPAPRPRRQRQRADVPVQGRVPGAAGDDGGLALRRFDAKGVSTAPPVVVLGSQRFGALLPAGDDALLAGAEGGRSFGIERLSRTGAIVAPYRDIARFPIASPFIYFTAARRGPEVLALERHAHRRQLHRPRAPGSVAQRSPLCGPDRPSGLDA